MSNLVARLRNQKYNALIEEIYADSREAADEIERLTAEVEQYRIAQKKLAIKIGKKKLQV